MTPWEGNTRDMTRAELAHWQDQATKLVRLNRGLTRFQLTVALEQLAKSMRDIGQPAPARSEWGKVQHALNEALGLDSTFSGDRLMERMQAQGVVKRDTIGTGKDLPNLSKRRG